MGEDGRRYYVHVSSDGKKHSMGTGLGEELSPEQYIALNYARHWGK
jgi:hypothetical protein